MIRVTIGRAKSETGIGRAMELEGRGCFARWVAVGMEGVDGRVRVFGLCFYSMRGICREQKDRDSNRLTRGFNL